MNLPFQNSIIRASAGSGKTYQLVRRYLRLLALGEAPETIVALTFTRKSAHEFFERILQKLADLASGAEDPQAYLREIRDANHARQMLRRVIGSMDRLKLGTIDSFFASVVMCFPYELGLSGGAEVMDENAASEARAQVMQRLMIQLAAQDQRQELSQLLEAWKTANFGQEGNRPARDLNQWIVNLHNLYLQALEEDKWASPRSIWKNKDAPIYQNAGEWKVLLERLMATARLDEYKPAQQDRWEEFFGFLQSYEAGGTTDAFKPAKYWLSEDRHPGHTWNDVAEGNGSWKMNRDNILLGPEWGQALIYVLNGLIQRELLVRLKRTQGKYKVVKRFDQTYHEQIRSAGKLSFSDLTWLLTGRVSAAQSDPSAWESMRLNWEYRLDSKFNHWMFDEFQDTSRKQWDIMHNLVDEAARDPEQRKTFFAVGDLKQSLYLWRQAEPDLFLHVEETYADERMEDAEPLVTSFRSSRAVLHTVNQVFDDEALFKSHYPEAFRWWRFERHVVSSRNENLAGYATFRSIENEGDKTLVWEYVAEIIREVNPLARHWSCAILTRSNEEAQQIAAALRNRLNCDVVCESEVQITKDNPATLLMLSLLTLAIHPQDKCAFQHLMMSPLASILLSSAEDPMFIASNLSLKLRREIAQHGMLETMKTWRDHLKAAMLSAEDVMDEFTQYRLDQWLDLCAQSDAQETYDLEGFVRSAETAVARSPKNPRALQVMTIHKSKGLEFDMVILPNLKNSSYEFNGNNSGNVLVSRDEQGEVQWIIDAPNSDIISKDPVLEKVVKEEKARLAYSGMCVLYVAMTRAKRALYMLRGKGKKAASKSAESTLLYDSLSFQEAREDEETQIGVPVEIVYETGQAQWYEEKPVQELRSTIPTQVFQKSEAELKTLLKQRALRPLERVSPSSEEQFALKGEELLSTHRNVKRHYGLLMHELFAMIESLDHDPAQTLANARIKFSHLDEPTWTKASESLLKCLDQPEIAELFRGSPQNEVWRERRFDLVHERKWLTGIADRVNLTLDASGNRVAARVVDFKTDSLPDEETKRKKIAGYTPQLMWYRTAIAKLAGLPEKDVGLTLIFTQHAERVDL